MLPFIYFYKNEFTTNNNYFFFLVGLLVQHVKEYIGSILSIASMKKMIMTKNYKTICYILWGSVPIDIEWAVNTNIYKEYMKQLIIEGNKLIAEFMGAVIDIEYEDTETYRFPLKSAPKEYASYVWSSDGLQYYSSWDWLMPVVFKIRDIENMENKASGVQFAFTTDYKKMSLDSIWTSVINFIKWHNQNKTT